MYVNLLYCLSNFTLIECNIITTKNDRLLKCSNLTKNAGTKATPIRWPPLSSRRGVGVRSAKMLNTPIVKESKVYHAD